VLGRDRLVLFVKTNTQDIFEARCIRMGYMDFADERQCVFWGFKTDDHYGCARDGPINKDP